jgi:anti-anti-sigma factor
MPPKKQEKLEMRGNLDIRQAEDLYETFKKLNGVKTNILLDFSDVDDIDFAIIQLLYSFKKSLADKKRKLIFKSVSEKVKSKIVLCDFKSLLQEN